MTLPPEILAFKLLRKANITKEEKLLVLTGMNYEIKTTLYEEAKKSLKKYKGSDGESCTSGSSIKIEPAFLVANEEALLAAGYTKTRVWGHSYGREKGAIWKRGRSGQGAAVGGEFQRPDSRRPTGRGSGYQRTESGSRVTQPSNRERKNMNPLGPDGRPLTCKWIVPPLTTCMLRQLGKHGKSQHCRGGISAMLNLTSSGHYCIPMDKSEEVPVESVCAVNLEVLNRKDRYKTLLKPHRQFAHPPPPPPP